MLDVQLTPTSFVVLGLLEAVGEATPYELKQAAATRLGNFWSLAHSQLYAEPERLARAGHVTERRETTGRRRRRYTLTERGRRAYRDWLEEPHTGGYELRDPGLLKLALGADPGRLASAQLAAHRARLEAYEAIAATRGAGAGAGGDGRLLALRAGIGHEREYIRFWSELAQGSADASEGPGRLTDHAAAGLLPRPDAEGHREGR
jgi:PadR family transcriptional regulator AphA